MTNHSNIEQNGHDQDQQQTLSPKSPSPTALPGTTKPVTSASGLRRQAERLGFRLSKYRRFHSNDPYYGKYKLSKDGEPVLNHEGFEGLTLEEVAAHLRPLDAARVARRTARQFARRAREEAKRFTCPVDLVPLAPAWATDYVTAVFPQAKEEERIRLLVTAEAGFLASMELSNNGIRDWEPILKKCEKPWLAPR
jgi:hypothetical protein